MAAGGTSSAGEVGVEAGTKALSAAAISAARSPLTVVTSMRGPLSPEPACQSRRSVLRNGGLTWASPETVWKARVAAGSSPAAGRSPQRQADVAARGVGAEGTVAGQQRVEEDIAVGGLNLETLDLGRGDVNVAAGGLRGEATGRVLDDQIAARGLQARAPRWCGPPGCHPTSN